MNGNGLDLEEFTNRISLFGVHFKLFKQIRGFLHGVIIFIRTGGGLAGWVFRSDYGMFCVMIGSSWIDTSWAIYENVAL